MHTHLNPAVAPAQAMAAPTSMLSAALQYIHMGVPVFPVWPVRRGACACNGRFGPCDMPGKHPATKWRKGKADELPTLDPAQAERWWGAGFRSGLPRSDFGIGVPTGKASGIYVVDVDNKAGKDGRATIAAHRASQASARSASRAPPHARKAAASARARALATQEHAARSATVNRARVARGSAG